MMYVQLVTILYGSLLGSVCGRLLNTTTAHSFFYAILLTLLRMALFVSSLVFLLHWQRINPILFVMSYIIFFWMRTHKKLYAKAGKRP